MAEQTSADDLFSSFGKWMNLAFECNASIIDSAIEWVAKPQQQAEAALGSLGSLTQSLLNSDPSCMHKLIDHQLDLMRNHLSLLEAAVDRIAGHKVEPVIRPSVNDRRFIDDEWNENPVFDYLKQSYLLNSQALTGLIDCLNLSNADRERVGFYVRQINSALAPSNFPLSNPEIVRKIQETKGESLIKGMEQLIADRRKSGDYLNVCMSDSGCFELGKNLATSPGHVVYENELIQLIQYCPSQPQAHAVPLLFIPSWINKYYIFDLQPHNSMVKWALDQGLTVFMISWVNPDERYRHCGIDDYLQLGLLSALAQVKQIAGSESVNCMGYCLGGTLLAVASGYLAKIGDSSIASATYLASSFDFTDPGDLRVMIDSYVINGMSESMDAVGYLDGRALAVTFSMLRENELYWNYYIQNYLKGERPSGFDILHWNSDSTNVPAKLHQFVMEKLVRDNRLISSHHLQVLGETIDMSLVDIPSYVLATEKDHIARWQSCYPGARVQRGSSKFVLAGSGHIAGVINPPVGNKYYYYTNGQLADDPAEWLDGAFKHEGSWWPDWYRWVSQHAGELSPALTVETARAIEDSPGRYVKRRLDENRSVACKAERRAA